MIVIAVADPRPDLRIEAVVALSRLSGVERLVLEAATRTAFRGTREFGHRAIEAIAPDGTTSRVAEDHVRLGFSVAPERASEGLALLDAILTRPAFLPEPLEAAARGSVLRSPWARSFGGESAPPWPVRSAEADFVWRTVVRPERLTVAFAGPGAEAAKASWLARKLDFPPAPAPGPARPEAPPPPIPSGLRIAVMEAPAPLDGATLLAASALGIGKGSLGWRALRQEAGRSYRVEAALAGAVGGWSLRLRFDVESSEEATAARERLRAAVDGMTESDRARALGVLASGLDGDAPPPFEIAAADLREPAYAAALFAAKGAGGYDPAGLLRVARETSLADLKARLATFVADAGISLR